ncbi:MAG: hypothetical protein JNL75_02095 [Chitinophagales bacterium]|nr:hypothetical protein [Chitinophagales bacterium]
MRIPNIILITLACIILACKENPYNHTSEYLKLNLGADNLTIHKSKDSVIIDIYYNIPPLIGFDFQSSSAALQFIDTAGEIVKKNSIEQVKVKIHANQQVTEYNYPIADLRMNQIGMNLTANFLQNFLGGRNQHNARYVDLDKISLEELFKLNTVNEQIQSTATITDVTFDGFSSHASEPQNIEFRGSLQSETETFPFIAQYDKNKNKIFYFGINE